jgi:hypothetical protein
MFSPSVVRRILAESWEDSESHYREDGGDMFLLIEPQGVISQKTTSLGEETDSVIFLQPIKCCRKAYGYFTQDNATVSAQNKSTNALE